MRLVQFGLAVVLLPALATPLGIVRAQEAVPAQAIASNSDYAQLARTCRTVSPDGHFPAAASTPVAVRVLPPVVAVPVTDGFIHLAYAAQVTNVSRHEAKILSIAPVDVLARYRPTGTNSVTDADGNDITGRVRLFNPNLLGLIDGLYAQNTTDFALMPGGSSGTTFFDVRYSQAADVPSLIAHRISIAVGTGYDKLDQTMTALSDPIPVRCDPPPVLSPPLVGSRWWNGNGCCSIVGPHRGATLPINGDLKLAEVYAIDYVQLRSDNTCCTGPVHDLSSWPFFGAPILAAATGTVLAMENALPEQVPAKDPVGVSVANAAGNYIIQSITGSPFYILYAHLKTGSIPQGIKVGSVIRVGQQIGQLGNSGSSTAPHLHFQVMGRPSALDSHGVPFVFATQKLEGTVKGTLNEAAAKFESGKAVSVDTSTTGWQSFRMPAETQVFGYNLP